MKYRIVRLKKDVETGEQKFKKGEVFHLYIDNSNDNFKLHKAEIPYGLKHSIQVTDKDINELFEDHEYKILKLKKDVVVYPWGIDYPVQLQKDKEFYVYKSLKHNSNNVYYNRAFAVNHSKQVISDELINILHKSMLNAIYNLIKTTPLYFLFNEDVEDFFKQEENMKLKEEKIASVKVNTDIVVPGTRRICKGEILDLFVIENSCKIILKEYNIPDEYAAKLVFDQKIITEAILDKHLEYYHQDVQVEYCEELAKTKEAYKLFEHSDNNGVKWEDCTNHPYWINTSIYRKKKPEIKKLTMSELMSGLLSGKVYVNNFLQYIKLDNKTSVVNVYHDENCTFISRHNSPLETFVPENWTLVK